MGAGDVMAGIQRQSKSRHFLAKRHGGVRQFGQRADMGGTVKHNPFDFGELDQRRQAIDFCVEPAASWDQRES